MGIAKQIADTSRATYKSMEGKLSKVFQPVAPRKEFVHGLGRNIQTVQRPALASRLTDVHFTIILIAGALTFITLVAVGVRTIIAFTKGRRQSLPPA